MLRRPHRRRVDARSPAVVGDRRDGHVEILLPLVDTVLADHDLAVAWSMNLDSRIVGPRSGRRRVAEEQGTAAVPENLAGARMVRRIKTECFARRARFDERLNDPV